MRWATAPGRTSIPGGVGGSDDYNLTTGCVREFIGTLTNKHAPAPALREAPTPAPGKAPASAARALCVGERVEGWMRLAARQRRGLARTGAWAREFGWQMGSPLRRRGLGYVGSCWRDPGEHRHVRLAELPHRREAKLRLRRQEKHESHRPCVWRSVSASARRNASSVQPSGVLATLFERMPFRLFETYRGVG